MDFLVYKRFEDLEKLIFYILETTGKCINRENIVDNEKLKVAPIWHSCWLKAPHQVIHVGFAGWVDVFQELQQVEGVTVHQMDSYGQIWLVLEKERKKVE